MGGGEGERGRRADLDTLEGIDDFVLRRISESLGEAFLDEDEGSEGGPGGDGEGGEGGGGASSAGLRGRGGATRIRSSRDQLEQPVIAMSSEARRLSSGIAGSTFATGGGGADVYQWRASSGSDNFGSLVGGSSSSGDSNGDIIISSRGANAAAGTGLRDKPMTVAERLARLNLDLAGPLALASDAPPGGALGEVDAPIGDVRGVFSTNTKVCVVLCFVYVSSMFYL